MMSPKNEVRTEIQIQATPAKVWDILTDFARYAEWNPFVRAIDGTPTKGSRLRVRIKPPGSRAMIFRPVLEEVAPPRELRWLGHLWIPGLFDGRHIFELYENSDGTTLFVHREEFKGWLVPLFRNMLQEQTPHGFRAMNEAIKKRAEGSSAH